MSNKNSTWEGLVENLETGLYHVQRPVGSNLSNPDWDRKRVGYVETDAGDSSVASVYRFSVKDVDGDWFVSLDFPDHSVLFSGMNYVPVTEIKTEDLDVEKEDGWEDFIDYLRQSPDNIEKLAENYLKTTNYMDGELLKMENALEEGSREAEEIKTII